MTRRPRPLLTYRRPCRRRRRRLPPHTQRFGFRKQLGLTYGGQVTADTHNTTTLPDNNPNK